MPPGGTASRARRSAATSPIHAGLRADCVPDGRELLRHRLLSVSARRRARTSFARCWRLRETSGFARRRSAGASSSARGADQVRLHREEH
jgi:hypothetical protein